MKRVINAMWLSLALAPTAALMSFSKINGKIVNDFRLVNTDGKFVSLRDYADAKGFIIVFTCNHCPFAKLYPSRLNELDAQYKPLGVPVIAISSTDTIVYEDDAYPEMVKRALKGKYSFPYLFDGTQAVAKDFTAQKTPHAYVIWKENVNWVVKYNGAIDDNGAEVGKVKNRYVAKAVDALLQKRIVETEETKSIGCQINFRK